MNTLNIHDIGNQILYPA